MSKPVKVRVEPEASVALALLKVIALNEVTFGVKVCVEPPLKLITFEEFVTVANVFV